MKKILTLIAATILIASCGMANKALNVSYTEAHGYFVRNDAPTHAPIYYASQQSFNNVFGCAAVMGKDGMPTAIDFARQSVIAVIEGLTNRPTEYTAISLTAEADTLRLKYSVKESVPTIYTMQPLLLLVIDKPRVSPHVKLER